MSDERWQRLQTLFEEAVLLRDEERGQFLEEACGNDAELRRDIDALLQADERETTGASSLRRLRDLVDTDSQLTGKVIDGWRILERIGVGGMGSVFLAERADGEFEQRAAIKIVKKGMDTENVVNRFRQERQILARLNHPNIANLLDGGVTDDGRPYFAMEYVDGVPITEYCDQHKLGVEQRLELFEHACDAVHHAHRSLVVHRDLKPSNILVTSGGDVKLLDFGIAKLLDESDDQHLTRTGMQVHTPAYAAPEQLMNEAITTATDVYALGVVLFELLSGRRPFEVRRTPSELRELVLTGDPPKPSTAILHVPADTGGGTGGPTIEELSARRGAGIDRLRKLLRGDLDTICLMAMHREPDHRYPSADQMAADIRRHLDGQPVVASPDSLAYRLGKFYRRNRGAVISSAAVVVAFVIMTVFYTVRLAEERDIALDEQRKANEVVDFVTGLFEVSDPSESRGEELSARDLLDAGAAGIRTELADRPSVQATMRRVLGEVYYSLGSNDRAQELLTTALEQQRQLFGENHLDVARTKIALAFLYQDRAEFDVAEPLYREALATRRSLRGGDHMDVMEAISAQAFFEETRGDLEKAEQLHTQSLQMGRRLFHEDHAFLAEAMTNLAGLYRVLDRNAEAEPILRDALAMQERIYGGPHPESASTKRQLAGLLRDTRRYEESQALFDEIIETRTRMLGPDHIELAHTWNSYSHLLADMLDHEGALEANRKFLDIMERAYAGPHPSLGAAYNNRANMLEDMNDLDGAAEYYKRSIEMQDLVELPPRHPNRSYPMSGLANVYRRQERFEEAEEIFVEVLALRRENFPEEHTLVSEAKSNLGFALVGLGRLDEAEALLLDAYERFLDSRGPEDARTGMTASRLAVLYDDKGDAATAEKYRALSNPE